MRINILTPLFALGVLAGCNKAPPPAPAAPAVANSVSGTIMLREPRALGDNARAELKVIDVSQPATPLAAITVGNGGRCAVAAMYAMYLPSPVTNGVHSRPLPGVSTIGSARSTGTFMM